MKWWVRPLVRLVAALLLPFIVPAVICRALFLLPNPVEMLCPPVMCTGQEELAKHWHMNDGWFGFYKYWLFNAISGDFGKSIGVVAGEKVSVLVWESLAPSGIVIGIALFFVFSASLLSARNLLPRQLDALWHAVGLVPSVILALVGLAIVEINYGPSSDPLPSALRIMFGAIVLAIADGTLAASIIGTRSIFDEELKQRYIGIALLRGESALSNALPNVLPALIGQLRGRVLQVLSAAVLVEVVLGIPGLGGLLWDGTLYGDFFIVLAAAWVFAIASGALMLTQALSEIAVEMHIRRAPAVIVTEKQAAAA